MSAKAIVAKAMDNIIHNEVVDESLWELWITEGCPDYSTIYDYKWYNESENSYNDLTDLFLAIIMKTIE